MSEVQATPSEEQNHPAEASPVAESAPAVVEAPHETILEHIEAAIEVPVHAVEKVAVDFKQEFEHVMDGFENNILMEGVTRLYALWAKLKASI